MALAKNNISIDYARLETEVCEKAEDYLVSLSAEDITEFYESAKFIAQSICESYFLAIDGLYSDGPLKLTDQTAMDRFSDFSTGYRAQMKEWMHSHSAQVRDIADSVEAPDPQMPKVSSRTPLIVAGVGTLAVAGLAVWADSWGCLAAEVVVLGAAAMLYKRGVEKQRMAQEAQMRQYKAGSENKKANVINGVIGDLKTWLGQAEDFSKKTLATFGID